MKLLSMLWVDFSGNTVYYENVLADCSAVEMVMSEAEVGAEDGSCCPERSERRVHNV